MAASTTDYEFLVGKRRFTLFDVSAISGAAISPLMGSATRQAYRILLTMANVRLGVWLPHPAIVDAASRELQAQDESAERNGRRPPKNDHWWHACGLLLWYAFPWHPRWSDATQEPGGREARLWAYVLRMRRKDTPLSRRVGGLFYHALQPTLGMLWAEAVGHTSYRSTWICVSDGGHYDNLGLVEALWRGAANVLVLDASGDKANTWYTLGGAIALARVDAGVDIELDPTTMCPKPLHTGEVAQPWAHGPFTRIGNWQSGERRSRAGAAGHGDDLGLQARLVGGCAVGCPGVRGPARRVPRAVNGAAALRRGGVRRLPRAGPERGGRRAQGRAGCRAPARSVGP